MGLWLLNDFYGSTYGKHVEKENERKTSSINDLISLTSDQLAKIKEQSKTEKIAVLSTRKLSL